MTARKKRDPLAGYKPITWPADSLLTAEQRNDVEIMRKDLWLDGIRGPLLTRMAFEFAAALSCMRAAKKHGIIP